MSYKCECADGYALNPDEQTCSATGKPSVTVFFLCQVVSTNNNNNNNIYIACDWVNCSLMLYR